MDDVTGTASRRDVPTSSVCVQLYYEDIAELPELGPVKSTNKMVHLISVDF